jgi:hypothetical protein
MGFSNNNLARRNFAESALLDATDEWHEDRVKLL